MSEGNLFSWAGAQPIWAQVFMGLALFFVGMPLIFFAITGFSAAFSELLSSAVEKAKGLSLRRLAVISAITLIFGWAFMYGAVRLNAP